MDESKIVDGNFYFIEEKYYEDVKDLNFNNKLMSNKETINGQVHDRPCFYSIADTNGIYWLIPISSQVDKYQAIYNQKAKKYKEVDTIVFGYVLGNKRAFLIQNMFPIIPFYITNEYIDKITNQPVLINDKLKKTLNQKAKKVLLLQRNGHKLIFPNVLEIEKRLLLMMGSTEAAATVPKD